MSATVERAGAERNGQDPGTRADLGIVIVSHEDSAWLPGCLSSIAAQRGEIALDIVVVENGGAAETVEVLRAFPEVRLLVCENRGFAHGNNRGLETLDTPYVLLLNPDTEIIAGGLDRVVAELAAQPYVGLLGVRQVAADGRLWPTMRRFPSPLRSLFEALGSERFSFRAGWLGERVLAPEAYEVAADCDWVSGSFMLARREALLAVGGLDEGFFLYCEEPDLCLRLRELSWRVSFSPSMTIVHHGGSPRWDGRVLAQEMAARRRYLQKHFSTPARYAGTGALALGLVLRGSTAGGARRRACFRALATLLGRSAGPFDHLGRA